MDSAELDQERENLEQAIAALEAQRSILGDAVVNTAVAPLQAKLKALTTPDTMASGSFDSERRIVTVLFCDMVGSTMLAEQLDPEAWTRIMNQVFRLLTEPVDRYGGTVTRLMGDAILALFGAPESHEDDPERAILAGLSILEKTRPYRQHFIDETGMDFDFRVGINTGLAVVGEVGSDAHVEYTAMGDAVNVAARMEQTAAPGVVQISEATYRLVSDLFEVADLGSITVKGRERPVEAYQVLGRKARPRRRGAERHVPLVGRQEELSKLRKIVEQINKGQGQIVLLIGEAGLGKSRLIAELRAEWLPAQPQEQELVRWREFAATSYSTSRPYGTFENQMRIIAGIAPTDSPANAREKLHQVLADDPEHDFLQSVYERLLGIHSEDQADLSSEAFKNALYDSTLKAIRQETKGLPSVLVFDDLQWVDPASLDLIEFTTQLAQEMPLLILMAMRPEPEAPAWGLRQRLSEKYKQGFSEINLDPLDDDESLHLADTLMVADLIPRALRRLVLDRAEGNPFYIEELVQMLLDQSKTSSSEIQVDLAEDRSLDTKDIPTNLLALVAARVDRLSRDVRLTLQMAAVIGRSFYVRVLNQIRESQSGLETHLQQLEMAEMIREAARQPEWEYAFRHALTQEAVYSTLLLEQRRSFHQAVGQALEQLYPGQREEFAGVLAYHYDEGQQLDKARDYYILAGNEAAMLHANDQALAYYQRALAIVQELGGESELIIDLYERLGRTLEHQHQFREALDNYHELERLGQELGNKSMVLASLTRRTILRANPTPVFNVKKTEELVDKALALAREIGDQLAEARINAQLSTLYSFMNKSEQALSFGDQALTQARAIGEKPLLALVLTDISSHLFSVNGQFRRASESLQEARILWREIGDKAMETDCLSTLAEVYVYTGEYDQALAVAEEARTISQSIHNLWGESHSQFMIGHVYWERGRPDLAISITEESIRLSVAAGFMVPQLVTRCDLAMFYAELGQEDKAIELFDMALQKAGKYDIFSGVYLAGLRAQFYTMLGQWQEADEALQRFIDSLSGREKSAMHIPGYQAQIDSALKRGQKEQALSLAVYLRNFVADIEARPIEMRVLLQQARAYLALNGIDEARDSLREAKEIGYALDSRWTMWQIEAQLGDIASDTDEALAHFQRARDLIFSIQRNTPKGLRDSFLNREDVKQVLSIVESGSK